MRTILSLVAVSTLVALAMFAQAPPGGGKGGGGKAAPKNLKFFTQENWADVGRPAMQTFVASLGLADKGGCAFCHDAQDKSLDTKMEKVMARMMLNMVKDINAKFPDGKQHVTCFTCHRGDTAPKMAP